MPARVSPHEFRNVSKAEVLRPALCAVWDHMCIGVAVVDGNGTCVYMNDIQQKVDGFSNISVIGQHITSLYVPHDFDIIPTMDCLQRGTPLLRKAYWYKTTNNYLASTVSDFIPLFDRGKRDGVLAFTIWVGTSSLTDGAPQAVRSRTPFVGKSSDVRYSFEDIIGQNATLQEVVTEARTAATTNSPVMIWGENGTGKEVFAQAIHAASTRRDRPFVAVNCAAIPENLLEGILFGTVKGTYTDATDSPGLFEKASGGTLLLDELNSMPLGLQAKLLRVVQEKRVRRLGSHVESPVDVRIISILNEPPLSAVEKGLLRSDLFYRLAVVGIAVPPLRERRDDIAELVASFIKRSELSNSPEKIAVTTEVMQMFADYQWPGNIRELLHVIEGSLALLGGGDTIGVGCLPRHFRDACLTQPEPSRQLLPTIEPPKEQLYDYSTVRRNSVIPLKQHLQAYETRCIRNVLRVTGGNVAKAARIMQLTGAGLRYKMTQLGIGDDDY